MRVHAALANNEARASTLRIERERDRVGTARVYTQAGCHNNAEYTSPCPVPSSRCERLIRMWTDSARGIMVVMDVIEENDVDDVCSDHMRRLTRLQVIIQKSYLKGHRSFPTPGALIPC